jgi:SAM-dependent methyltransferase
MINFPKTRVLIPPALRPGVKKLLRVFPSKFKYRDEIEYWQEEWASGRFCNDYYEQTMLLLAGEPNAEFLRDKIVADFGCGPQGSLCWAKPARTRIGIDVLADVYTQFGIHEHNMVYVVSSENAIPLPSNYVDVVFTTNAFDHVSSLSRMAVEIVRIMRLGGLFVGSFNIGERPTFSEPHTLSEDIVHAKLLRHLSVEVAQCFASGPKDDAYKYLREGNGPPIGPMHTFRVKARKPDHRPSHP